MKIAFREAHVLIPIELLQIKSRKILGTKSLFRTCDISAYMSRRNIKFGIKRKHVTLACEGFELIYH